MQRTLQAALGPDVAADDAPDLLLDVARRGGAQLDAAWGFLRECVPSSRKDLRLGTPHYMEFFGSISAHVCSIGAHVSMRVADLHAQAQDPAQIW